MTIGTILREFTGTPEEYAFKPTGVVTTASPLAVPGYLSQLFGTTMPLEYDEANRHKIQREIDIIDPRPPLGYMPRYVTDVLEDAMPGYTTPWDRMFTIRVGLCGAEMRHDFGHFLHMAYHDSTVRDWWKNNVLCHDRQAESYVDDANSGGSSLRYTLLGIRDDETSGPASCLLLKYGMGSGKTILQAALLAEMVSESKSNIRRGICPGHLPHPTKPAIVIFATIAERDSFYNILRSYLVFDNDADIFCINDSLRFSRDCKRIAVESCYVALCCLAGIMSTFTDRVTNEDIQAELDRSCATVNHFEHVDPQFVGQSMAKLLRLRVPFRSRPGDLNVLPSMLLFSEFTASVDQMIGMLSLCPMLDDIIMTWGRTARWVLMDGADLGDSALRFASAFKGLDNVILHFNFAPPRTMKTIQMNRLNHWASKLDGAIASGSSPIVITCDTVRDVNAIYQALVTLYHTPESEIYKCTGLDNDTHKALLSDLPTLASKHRFILTSPVLQRGISDSVTDVGFQCALFRGTSVKARSATQPLNRFRLSTEIEVCVHTPPIEMSTDVGTQAVYLLNTIAYCKFADGGLTDPTKFKPFHHVPFRSGVNNQRHQAGWSRPMGGPSISGASYLAGVPTESLIRVNREMNSRRYYYVCQCGVLTPEVQDTCVHCRSEFAKVLFEAECTTMNPYFNVNGQKPSWYLSGGVYKLDRPVPFNPAFQFNSTLAGRHFKPIEHAAILQAADRYKSGFRFMRAFVDSATCEGYTVLHPSTDSIRLSDNAKALVDLLNERPCAASLRVAELLDRLDSTPSFNVERRVLAYRRLLGMADTITIPDLRLLQEMSWPWSEKADKPNFFDELHTALGLSSALTETPIVRTLDLLGNRPIEWYKECRPSSFDATAMGMAYETWLLMHLISMAHLAKPSPIFEATNGAYGNFILECFNGEIKWNLSAQEATALLSTKVQDKERVAAFLSLHTESIRAITNGKCRLTSDPTLEGLFDALSAVMWAVLGIRPVKSKPRRERENGRGVSNPASSLTYKLPHVAFQARLMIIYCRAVRGTNVGFISNPDIVTLLRPGIGRIPKDHWFCDILCGVDHPGEAPDDVTFLRTSGVTMQETANLNKFAKRVLAFLADKPEAAFANSAKRALIEVMWREIARGASPNLPYEPTDTAIQAFYGDLVASLDADDTDSPDLTQWYQQDEEEERQADLRMHANIRTEGTYQGRRVRARSCQFIDDQAGS